MASSKGARAARKARAIPATRGKERKTGTPGTSTSLKPLRRRAKTLEELPGMPLDILAEIFSHLLSHDLINLARTTKAFRALLMHRGAAPFWRASRNLAGLPNLPQHLSEPAYASLVYSNHCHNCFKQNIRGSVIWQFAVRYCRACKDKLTVKVTGTDPDLKFLSYLRGAHLLINVAPVRFSCGLIKTWGFYHRPQLIQLRTQHEELDEEQWLVYIEQQQKRVEAIQEHAAACTRWADAREEGRRTENESRIQGRLAFVKAKLRDIGWGQEVDMLDPEDKSPLSKNKHVMGKRAINEDTWHKVEDDILGSMQCLRDARLQQEWDEERRKIMRERLETLREMYHKKRGAAGYDESTERLPNFVDFAIGSRLTLDTPTQKSEARDFDVEALEWLLGQLPTFDELWIDFQQERLAELLKEKMEFTTQKTGDDGKPIKMTTKDILSLAIAVFECKECGERMHSDDAMAHRCTRYDWMRQTRPRNLYLAEVADMVDGRGYPRDTSCFVAADVVAQVRACGMDPMTATAEEMRAKNAHFAVRIREGDRTILNWNAMVRVGIKHAAYQVLSQDKDDDNSWISLAIETGKEAVEKAKGQLLSASSKYWCCRLCDNMSRCLSHDEIVTHLAHEHDKTELTYDQVRKLTFFHPDVNFVLAKSSICSLRL